MMRALLFLGLVAGTGLAYGAPADKADARYQQVKKYDFDDDKVEGTLVRPDDIGVEGRIKPTHQSLIQPRLTFVPEMIKSVEHL